MTLCIDESLTYFVHASTAVCLRGWSSLLCKETCHSRKLEGVIKCNFLTTAFDYCLMYFFFSYLAQSPSLHLHLDNSSLSSICLIRAIPMLLSLHAPPFSLHFMS